MKIIGNYMKIIGNYMKIIGNYRRIYLLFMHDPFLKGEGQKIIQ